MTLKLVSTVAPKYGDNSRHKDEDIAVYLIGEENYVFACATTNDAESENFRILADSFEGLILTQVMSREVLRGILEDGMRFVNADS